MASLVRRILLFGVDGEMELIINHQKEKVEIGGDTAVQRAQ